MTHNSRIKWMETGYELFASEGADGIQVERLARVLNRNKSGFYHYFHNPDNFLDELLDHHRGLANQMAEETLQCKMLDPDYFKVLLKYKLCVLVQGQLAWKISNTTYRMALEEVRKTLELPLIPLWCKAFNLPDDPKLAYRHLILFRNNFYGHASKETITLEFLHNMMNEARDVMQEIFRLKSINRNAISKENVVRPRLSQLSETTQRR